MCRRSARSVLDLRLQFRTGYSSVAGKLGPFPAVKTGLGECPRKRGSPEKLELRSIIRQENRSFYCSNSLTTTLRVP